MSKRTANMSISDLQPKYICFPQMIYFMQQEETHALKHSYKRLFRFSKAEVPAEVIIF